jgi:hypothetical protein
VICYFPRYVVIFKVEIFFWGRYRLPAGDNIMFEVYAICFLCMLVEAISTHGILSHAVCFGFFHNWKTDIITPQVMVSPGWYSGSQGSPNANWILMGIGC